MAGDYTDFLRIAKNANIDYVIGDPHFEHMGSEGKGILFHTDRNLFFKDVKEMGDYIIESWNSVVSKKSGVAIVGDFAFSNHSKYLNALNGKKILIRGDHDKMPIEVLNNFSGVYPALIKKIDKVMVTFYHYAQEVWAGMHKASGGWQIYAHSHGRLKEGFCKTKFDSGFDVWFIPIPWGLVCYKMEAIKSGKFNPDYSACSSYKDFPKVLARNNLQLMAEYDISLLGKIKKEILEYYEVENGPQRSGRTNEIVRGNGSTAQTDSVTPSISTP